MFRRMGLNEVDDFRQVETNHECDQPWLYCPAESRECRPENSLDNLTVLEPVSSAIAQERSCDNGKFQSIDPRWWGKFFNGDM